MTPMTFAQHQADMANAARPGVRVMPGSAWQVLGGACIATTSRELTALTARRFPEQPT